MAVANTKSSSITNADASPKVANNSFVEKGIMRSSVATLAVAAADDNDSVYRFVRLPSNARLCHIWLLNDAITSGTDYNFGIYETADNGGAAKDDNVFADAVDLSSARVEPIDILFEALDIDEAETRLWQMLALTEDPHKDYDLCAIGVTVGTGAGDITLNVEFVL